MIDLPPALAPWRRSLALFPRDVALALGEIVGRLAPLIGPLPAPEGGVGDPDGVGGIGRRGAFERLLAAEWALAEEVPDEFLRRLTMGELAFIELAHRRPAAARRSMSLFDAGCDQLGAPRLVHLAVLVLLAERARKGGASFGWGVLQDASCARFEEVSEASVRALLAQRCGRRASADDAGRWQAAIGPGKPEVWIVGAPEAAEVCAALGGVGIEIEDSFDPGDPESVVVRVRHGGAMAAGRREPRAVRLALPPATTAVRLVREPFRPANAAPSRAAAVAPGTPILFSRDRGRLYVRGEAGCLLTVRFPHSPQVSAPKLRVFWPRVDEVLVGVGERHDRKETVVVTARDAELFVHTLSKRGVASVACRRVRWPKELAFPPPEGRALGLVAPLASDRLLLCDGARLLDLDGERVSVLRDGVCAIQYRHGVLRALTTDDPPRIVSLTVQPGGGAREERAVVGPAVAGAGGVVFGPPDLVAFQTTSSSWTVIGAADRAPRCVRIREGDEVIGVLDLGAPHGICLLVVRSTRLQIDRIGVDSEACVVTSSEPIAAARASDVARYVAFTTRAGAILVYSMIVGALVLQAVPWAS